MGRGFERSKTPMLSSPKEATLEDVALLGVLAVHPPGEVERELLEDALQEGPVAAAGALLVDLVDTPGGPGEHGRVHVAERPFVGRELAVGVHVPLAQEEDELLLREVGVDHRQGHAVKGQVPRRVPGVLPLVRHRDDVGVVEVRPVGVAPSPSPCRRGRLGRVAVEPVLHDVVVELLRPEHAGEGLTHDPALLRGACGRDERVVELVGFSSPRPEDLLEVGPNRNRAGLRSPPKAQPDHPRLPRRDRERVVGGALGAGLVDVQDPGLPSDEVVVEGILGAPRARGRAVKARAVRLVFREEELGVPLAPQPEGAVGRVVGDHRRPGVRTLADGAKGWARRGVVPRPGVAKPEGGEQVERSGLRTAVRDLDSYQDVLGRGLRVLDRDVEVAPLVEDAGVEDLVLPSAPSAPGVLLDQPTVRKLGLGVLVEVLHVRVGRRRVELVVKLLHVLAVVPLRPREAEEPLLEDRVLAVPERDGEAEDLVAIADACEAVLVPPVGARACMVVGEVLPRGAARGVVLPDGAPGPVGDVGAPALPVGASLPGLDESIFLPGHVCLHSFMDFRTPRPLRRVSVPLRKITAKPSCPAGP